MTSPEGSNRHDQVDPSAGPPAHRPELPDDDDDFVAPRSKWHYLLIPPIVLPLLTPLWNRNAPELFGMPFFYWFQLALIAFCSVTVGIVYLKTKGL